jgi:hypothetical protein
MILILLVLLSSNLKSELDGLVETERAFARLSIASGTREAFLANLSDESVLFRPGPVPGKSWTKDSTPPASQLDWQPEFADISQAADLGYTTGPWQLRRTPQDPPAAFGHYVTLWKKQPDGHWKIAIDIGVSHANGPKPGAVNTPKLKSDILRSRPDSEILQARTTLLDLENHFPAATDQYLSLFADDARLYRGDEFPFIGVSAIRKLRPATHAWKVAGVEVARSADLAYSYGLTENGNYLRIWKRQKSSWKIALDLIDEPEMLDLDLSWIAGDWETILGNVRVDEHWTDLSGGSMLGMSRTVSGGRTLSFEYLRIESRPDGIYYVAHPRAKSPGTDFKLVRSDRRQAVFENLSHDFPKRIIYRLNPDGSLTARVEGDGSEKEKAQEFSYKPIRRN